MGKYRCIYRKELDRSNKSVSYVLSEIKEWDDINSVCNYDKIH